MTKARALMTGVGLGALTMYLLDPETGRRRRALAKGRMERLQRTGRGVAATARNLGNRAQGLAEMRDLFSLRGIPDEVLEQRVRSKLGYLVRHPGAIGVRAADGRVVLLGPVLADECDQLLEGVKSVRGVREIENGLEVHETPGSVPGLQGDQPKPKGLSVDLSERRWAPATRFLVSTAGLILPYLISRKLKKKAMLSSLVLLGVGMLTSRLPQMDGPARARQSAPGSDREPTIESQAGWGM